MSSTCEEFKFRGWYDAAFRLGQETQMLFEFQQTRWASRSKSRSRSQDVSSLALYLMSLLAETKRRVIPATKFKFFTSTWQLLLHLSILILKLEHVFGIISFSRYSSISEHLSLEEARLPTDHVSCTKHVWWNMAGQATWL